MLFIFLYSLVQGQLTWTYIKYRKKIKNNHKEYPIQHFPIVTVQLPFYNEKYVAARILDAVAKLDYPKDKLEIQILDDSTDETVTIINQKISDLSATGLVIKLIRRTDRKGYKAGALEEGLKTATGEFIAIFDADFLPQLDFLKRTIPNFTDPKIGMIQTRWGHLNQDFSLMTRVQALGLDAFFTVEQTAKNQNGCFINFNGSAGIWRKSCILDAGNWQSDTLTEDLDLSYRAQLKGWKFLHLEDIITPAELPPVISVVKSQQYRWIKGGTETARKLLKRVINSRFPFKVKWQAFFHLLNTMIFPALLCAAVCSIPMLLIPSILPAWKPLFYWMTIFVFSFVILGVFYYVAYKQSLLHEKKVHYFIPTFILFQIISMGLSFHNTLAVLDGLRGKKTPFIRTPKLNISPKKYPAPVSDLQRHISFSTWIEGLLVLYFTAGIVYAIYAHTFWLLPFHLFLILGFGLVFWDSVLAIGRTRG